MEPILRTLDNSGGVNLRNILLATDFSRASEKALHYTLNLARHYNSRMVLAHVVPLETHQRLTTDARRRALDNAWREAQTHMTDLIVGGKLGGILHQVQVAQGDTWEELSKMVRQHDIDLLVIGTRGRSRLKKLLLGSVAEAVFRQAPCPVLTVGPNVREAPEQGPQRILFATGFSAHSLNAGNFALALAQHQQAKLFLLHVSKSPQEMGKSRQEIELEAQTRLRQLIPDGCSLAKPPEFRVEFGTAAEEILRLTEKERIDLIVLGVRQPEGFARRLKWATAYAVVSNAHCPVLTVRMVERV